MCGWFDLGDFNHFDLLHFSIFALYLRPNGSGMYYYTILEYLPFVIAFIFFSMRCFIIFMDVF